MTCCFVDASFSSFAWVIFSSCISLWNEPTRSSIISHSTAIEHSKLDGSSCNNEKFHQIVDGYTMYFNNLYHTSFTGRMPFQSPNQQCQSIEMKISHASPQAHLGVFQLCLWPLIAPGYLGEGCHASRQPSNASTPYVFKFDYYYFYPWYQRSRGVWKTRNSADADNRLDAFSGQSRSTNMVPFHMLHMVSYCANSNSVFNTRRFYDIRLQKISWPWNGGQRSLKVIESGIIR